MGSPITLSGFNQIDFNVILNAIMQQERLPVTQLESQKVALEAQKAAFSTLASKLAALESATESLTEADAFDGTKSTVSDTTRVAADSSGTASPGTYEITVLELARAQVTTASAVADKDTTVVASGGTLTIGGKSVVISGDVTLQGLADAINGTEDIGVSASIVRNDSGYQLVLTGKSTGAGNGFDVVSALAGDGLTFSQAQAASDAEVSINSVIAKSSTNSFQGVIEGLNFTVLKKDLTTAVTITITASSESVKSLIQKLVSTFNEVVKFIDDQSTAANRGESNNIGRDSLLRGLRRSLTSVLAANYGTGSHPSLALVGLGFDRTGRLTFDEPDFDRAMEGDASGVRALFQGTDGAGGAFGSLAAQISQYTDAGGLVPNAQTRLTSQVTQVTKRIDDLEDRLEVRRAALQREFIAADAAIAQLKAMSGQLGSMNSQLGQF
jgi:flagellar hook-associated protein 2